MGKRVFRTKLCDMLGIEYPILSAGQVSALIDEIKPAAQVLDEMVEQAAGIIVNQLPQNVIVK